MEFKVKLSNLRIAPRKVRMIADMIRGKKAEEARSILRFTIRKPALPMLKLLDSALANAKTSYQVEAGNLYISTLTIDEGAKYKRWMPRARGSASEIQKKTSHINLVLREITEGAKPKKARKAKKSEQETTIAVQDPAKEQEKKAPAFDKSKIKHDFSKPKPKNFKGISRIFRRKAV